MSLLELWWIIFKLILCPFHFCFIQLLLLLCTQLWFLLLSLFSWRLSFYDFNYLRIMRAPDMIKLVLVDALWHISIVKSVPSLTLRLLSSICRQLPKFILGHSFKSVYLWPFTSSRRMLAPFTWRLEYRGLLFFPFSSSRFDDMLATRRYYFRPRSLSTIKSQFQIILGSMNAPITIQSLSLSFLNIVIASELVTNFTCGHLPWFGMRRRRKSVWKCSCIRPYVTRLWLRVDVYLWLWDHIGYIQIIDKISEI